MIRKRFFRNEAQTMGLLFALLALAVMLAGAFASPRLGTVDTGKYEPIMKAAGLKDTTQGEPLYSRVIETYAYGHFSFAKLLGPIKTSSLLYPIALIRLLTQPFGLGFSTLYLYILYAALAALAVYMIVKGAAHLWGRFGVIPGLFLVLLLSDRNLTAYFGSLYETGTLILALLLFIGCALRGFTYQRGHGFGAILPYVLAAIFLLNASSRAVVFIPAAAAIFAGLIVQEWPSIRDKRSSSIFLLLLLVCAIYSSWRYFVTDPDNTSPAAAYHAVFQGVLPASEEPRRDLEELGLDASHLGDIGKSFYQDAADYVHDPRGEDAEIIFSTISTKKVLAWYVRHPGRFLHTILGTISGMNTLESSSTLGVGQLAQSTRKTTRSGSLLGALTKLLLPGSYGFFLWTAGIAILLAAGLWIWRILRGWDRRTRWIAPTVLILSCAAMALYLPLHVALMGSDSLDYDRIVSVFLLVVLWGGLSFVGARAITVGSVWFRRIYEEDQADRLTEEAAHEPPLPRKNRFAAFMRTRMRAIASSRRNTVLTTLILALVMVFSIQFATPRAGTVNNGDYGRMMDQLDLTWTSELYYDTSAQAGSRVIEEFAYRSGIDLAKLTALKPTYSLIYPATIVRGFCAVFGLPFSTWYMSLVMSAVLVLCILSIVRDLHAYFGRYTLITGIGLCLILLSESYLVWFNSLFGEGSILLGVMMVLACCVRLAVLPQGKGVPWVFALAFSAMFLTTAKAQMLVSLPILLILLSVFALYHRPLRVGRLVAFLTACVICMGSISYKAIRVYQDNSRVSERQTVWQSLFYGALMSSDDPLGDMQELGIPLEMAADIGKHAYYADEEYVIAPNSPEADAALYNRVNTFTMIGYYLKKPLQLLRMLDYTAGESQEVYNGFRAYLGQDYADADAVDRWGLWLSWRPLFAFAHFWEYALVYGALLVWSIRKLRSKGRPWAQRLLIATYLGVMLIGALQFPLTTIGNGFADNHKQLFGFLLCHDLLLLLGTPAALLKLKNRKTPR